MTERNIAQSILNTVLGKYLAEGFRLINTSPDVLSLYYKDDLLVRFCDTGVTIVEILAVCDTHIWEQEWLQWARDQEDDNSAS